MNRHVRRTSPLVATGAVGLLALTACGSGDGSGGQSTGTSDGSDITLNALFLDTDVYNPCVADYVERFTTETGIQVQVESEGYATYHDKILTTLSAGSDTYDLIMVAYQWSGEFSPFLVPITDRVAEDEDVLGGILDAATETYVYQGEQYGIPFTAQAETLFYRTDLFADAGLEPPTSWEEFTETADFFTDNPDYPGVYGTSVKAATQHAQTQLLNRYYGMGGEAIGDPGSSLDIDILADALEQLKQDAVEFSPAGALAAGFAESSAQFAAGTVAMAELMPTTILGLVNTEGDSNEVYGNVGATVVPGGHGETGGWGLGVTTSSQEQDAAYQLAAYLTSEEADLGCFLDYGKPAVQEATYEDPDVMSNWQTQGILAALSGSMGKARGETASRINSMMDETTSRFLAGQAGDAQDAARDIADQYASLVGQ